MCLPFFFLNMTHDMTSLQERAVGGQMLWSHSSLDTLAHTNMQRGMNAE